MYHCTRDVDNYVRKSRGGSGYSKIYSECKYTWAAMDLSRQVVVVCLYILVINEPCILFGAILVQTPLHTISFKT